MEHASPNTARSQAPAPSPGATGAREAALANPALASFAAAIRDELVVAQVKVLRSRSGFEVRHAEDGLVEPEKLREVRLEDLRGLAQFTATGAFRPLKSSPDLQRGWRLAVSTESELDEAFRHLYPGAIADWNAARSSSPPVTCYREFTARQTGMYRITQKLTDSQAATAIRACCHRTFCLKRRLWSVPGLEPDAIEAKSLIPCLEPCAILLEFTRRCARIEQQEKLVIPLPSDDVATLIQAIKLALGHPVEACPSADMNAPQNPRRLQRLLEILEGHASAVAARAQPASPHAADPEASS